MTQEVKDSVQCPSIIGENQYKKFLSEVLEFKRKSIHDVITKNNLEIFKKKKSTSLCKSKQNLLSLKQDWQLYESLYVAYQTCKSDLSDFFRMKIIHTHQLCQNLRNSITVINVI